MMHIAIAPSGIIVHSQAAFPAQGPADHNDLAFLALSYSLWGKKLVKAAVALLP